MARMNRPPDRITPPTWGAGPVDYPRHVQPVLDRYCIKCHSGPTARKVDLTGDRTRFYSLSYETLIYGRYVDYYYINAGPNGVFPALKTGSLVSKLTKLIEAKHGKVDVDEQGRRAIYAWIDANVPYYSTWDMTRPHTMGGRDGFGYTRLGKGPVWASQGGGRRLSAYQPWVRKFNDFARKSSGRIKPINFGGGNTFHQRGRINLTRPEFSPLVLDLLAKSAGGRAEGKAVYFKSKADPNYKALIEILLEAGAAFKKVPRIDMKDAKPILQERRFDRVF